MSLQFVTFRSAKEWTQIANNIKPTGTYLLRELEPASWYHLRVTAHNNAGFAVAEYEFATLSDDGSTYLGFWYNYTPASCYFPHFASNFFLF